jgi:hypothetical protein
MFASFDMGIKHIAFAVFDETLIDYGRITISGRADTIIGSTTIQVFERFDGVGIDTVVYENGYLANSPKILMDLSKITGAVLGGMWMVNANRSIPVPPITWQTGIGVGRTSEENYNILRTKYSDKSIPWIKKRDRENRKQLIIDFVNKTYDLELKMDKNDEADAIALGHYAKTRWDLTS